MSKRPPRPTTRKPAAAAALIRILLVDDHPVVREGLRSCFSRLPQLSVVGEAASGEEALRKVRRLKPDVVLMDINMPGMNGLTAATRMRRLAPSAKVLILSVHENREYVAEVARSGARGYILKDAAPAELVHAIESVHRGEGFFSPSVAAAMLKNLGGLSVASDQPDLAWLSAREQDVLALIACGASSKQISERFGVAMSTVKTLRERLMRKLGLHGVATLTQFAMEQGLSVSTARSRAK
jgi:DNA-binding NarL/FixJ family response regulator